MLWLRSKRYDGKTLIKAPPFEALPRHSKRALIHKTSLDRRLYEHALRVWRSVVAAEDPASFAEDLRMLRAAQSVLEDACASTLPHHAACAWYRLDDLKFRRLIGAGGLAPRVEFT
jgi:hypothetical protein